MKKWLIVFLGFLSILVISHILLMLEPIPVFLAINMLQILSATGLWGLLVSPLFFPGILYGMPRPPESRANIVVKKEEPVFNGEKNSLKTKKQIQIFESDYLLSIGEKADSYMTEFKPFLQPDFNLVQFSVLTNLPIHHLAFFFREIRKQTFIDYRNRFRIDYAKNLILEGKTTELTLEAIGIISGFSSRNTFFTAFKKVEGTSPGSFASQFTA